MEGKHKYFITHCELDAYLSVIFWEKMQNKGETLTNADSTDAK